MKKELGFKASLEELDSIFFLRDYILREGYVSSSLSRAISHRIVDLFLSWNNYLHGMIMPNPQYLPNVSESELFDEEEKKDIILIISKIMSLSSRNSLIGVNKDKSKEGKFIDDSVVLWNDVLNPKLTEILKKVNKYWSERK